MTKTRFAIPVLAVSSSVLAAVVLIGSGPAGAVTKDPNAAWTACMKKNGVTLSPPKGAKRPGDSPTAMPTASSAPNAAPSGRPPAGGKPPTMKRPAGVSPATWKKATAACKSKQLKPPSGTPSPTPSSD